MYLIIITTYLLTIPIKPYDFILPMSPLNCTYRIYKNVRCKYELTKLCGLNFVQGSEFVVVVRLQYSRKKQYDSR